MKLNLSGVCLFCLLSLQPTGCPEQYYTDLFTRYLPDSYVPGEPVRVCVALDTVAFYFEIYETIPAGWTVVSSDLPVTSFDPGSGTIFWLFEPEGIWWWVPFAFCYDVMPPTDRIGEASFAGHVCYAYTKSDPLTDVPITGDTVIPWRPPEGAIRTRPGWATIQATIDASQWGDTVMVSGRDTPFVENIVMKPGVNLVGFLEWPDYRPPVIEAADPSLPAITAAPYTKISGFIIRSSPIGILINDPTAEISNCVITGTENAAVEYVGTDKGQVTNCTIVNNSGAGILCHDPSPEVVVANSILFANGGQDAVNSTVKYSLLEDEIDPGWGENNISGDPMFVNPAGGDYRVLPGSPCIDAGDNSAVYEGAVDLLGKPRIMFGGKSETVDIGACEYWHISAARQPGSPDLELKWSSRPERTYSVFFSEDLKFWHLADQNVPSGGNTTLWLDSVGWPPTVPTRFYLVAEND